MSRQSQLFSEEKWAVHFLAGHRTENVDFWRVTLVLSLCMSLLWGFVKDSGYVPPLPMSLKELRDRITHELQTITADLLHRVWDEFDYRVDVCRVTQGAHIEGL
jgi:hypothetical protein